MARTRDLKPGFFKNEILSQLSPYARLFFAGLWCWADRNGRLEDRPARLKAEILPYDDCNPEKLLKELEEAGFISRYEVSGCRFIQIDKFLLHQKPHPKEPDMFPAKPEKGAAEPEKGAALPPLTLLPSNSPSILPSQFYCSEPAKSPASEPNDAVLGDKERCCVGEKETCIARGKPVLVFPVVGHRAKEWVLTEEKLAEYIESFPGIDVLSECRRALQWCRDNPTKRKTTRGMPKFLSGWLGKSQDRSGRSLLAPSIDSRQFSKSESPEEYRKRMESLQAKLEGKNGFHERERA